MHQNRATLHAQFAPIQALLRHFDALGTIYWHMLLSFTFDF
jgi:hypothetical protein